MSENNNQRLCQCGELINIRSKQCRSCRPCSKCKQVLSKNNYRLKKNGFGGFKYRSCCIQCESQERKRLFNKNYERNLQKKKDYNKSNPNRVRRWGRRNGWRKIGLDPNLIEEYLKNHDNCCEICGDKQTSKRLHVDHDHSTGKFRGVLCSGCNTGLGLFQEDIGRLLKAVQYLTIHASPDKLGRSPTISTPDQSEVSHNNNNDLHAELNNLQEADCLQPPV